MKIAVITPYHNIECPYFNQCLQSVRQQTYKNIIHITIGDGCNLSTLSEYHNVHNIPLPQNLNNFGDSPRSIGVIYAFSLGVDAVTFLDSDNWYAPEHIESMVEACLSTKSDIVTSLRYINHLNGDNLGICPESNGHIFCDTNCLMLTKTIAEEAGVWWLIPNDLHVIDDRVVWDTVIHASSKIACTGKATIHYRTGFAFHYHMFGITAPEGVKQGEKIAELGEVIDSLQFRAKTRFEEIAKEKG